jgi:hypothetical protein
LHHGATHARVFPTVSAIIRQFGNEARRLRLCRAFVVVFFPFPSPFPYLSAVLMRAELR